MPRFMIERDMPGAGKMSKQEWQAIARKSTGILRELGPQIQWVESFVTADRVYSVYIAPNEAAIRDHAKRGEFPANRISRIEGMIDPTTAE